MGQLVIVSSDLPALVPATSTAKAGAARDGRRSTRRAAVRDTLATAPRLHGLNDRSHSPPSTHPYPKPNPAALLTCNGILLRLKVHIQNEVPRLLALVLRQKLQSEGQVNDVAAPGNAGAWQPV